jgi:hypothetical protein
VEIVKVQNIGSLGWQTKQDSASREVEILDARQD